MLQLRFLEVPKLDVQSGVDYAEGKLAELLPLMAEYMDEVGGAEEFDLGAFTLDWVAGRQDIAVIVDEGKMVGFIVARVVPMRFNKSSAAVVELIFVQKKYRKGTQVADMALLAKEAYLTSRPQVSVVFTQSKPTHVAYLERRGATVDSVILRL